MGFYSESVSEMMILLWTSSATAVVEAAQYTFYTISAHQLEYEHQTNAWTSSEPRPNQGQYNPLAPGFLPEYFSGSAIRIKTGEQTSGRFATIEDDDDAFTAQDDNQIIMKYDTHLNMNVQVINAGHTNIHLKCNGLQGRIHALKSTASYFSGVGHTESVFFFSGAYPEPASLHAPTHMK